MKIKIFLYPDYLSLKDLKRLSSDLLEALNHNEVGVEIDHWNGTLDGVPQGEPVIIMAHADMRCVPKELSALCDSRGHLLFSGNDYINSEGRREKPPTITREVEFFLGTIIYRQQFRKGRRY